MHVDRAKPRQGDDVRWDQPGETTANDQVRVEGRQHFCQALWMARNNCVDSGLHGLDDTEIVPAPALPRTGCGYHPNDPMTKGTQHLIGQVIDATARNIGEYNDAPPLAR